MNLTEYQSIIAKTAVYPQKVDRFGIAYTFLGVMDEMFELQDKQELGASEKEIKKEKGDVVWYITAMAEEFKLNVEVLFVKSDIDNDADRQLFMRFPGLVKKFYRDSKEIPVETVSRFITIMWNMMMEDESDENINKILQMNYDKLIKRRETNTLHGDGDNREEI